MLSSFKNSSYITYECKHESPPFIDEMVDGMMEPCGETHRGRAVLSNLPAPRNAVLMQSNDYLSIAADTRIARAKADVLLKQGHGDAISRVFAHSKQDMHRQFEYRIADLTGAEDAVLMMSGYNANTGVVQTFARPATPVYIDIMAHASLWEGILCARAKARPFRHNNAEDLKRKIRRYGPGLVIVDSLYSTNGNLCPLGDFVDVAEEGGCAIIVDETHSFGCHGLAGAGITAALGLTDRVHFRTMGLSKAIAARGGVIVGSARNMEYLRYEARPMIFSTSVLGYEIAGFNAALDIIAAEPWRQAKLHANHRYLRTGLLALGYDVRAADSQIISIITGGLENTVAFRRYLDQHGLMGSVFCPPATPDNKMLLRLTVNASLQSSELQYALDVCESAVRDLDMRGWPSLLP
ncbi:alpha-hydroxyketone-type quorum-sensing autoinducer synthase [Kordiimonas aestuarii]|uniref:alpha-hydroxyketone-type quorum-sensing autoinducer synthase n=1 Tax=Kordiimonas aestuarii TaxID=1005925 RepID=UPI0021CEC98E|nr:alpha-hydroxyketone-type quorum-sensing autoinducer synthase [Kordiimonas aestuarii]